MHNNKTGYSDSDSEHFDHAPQNRIYHARKEDNSIKTVNILKEREEKTHTQSRITIIF